MTSTSTPKASSSKLQVPEDDYDVQIKSVLDPLDNNVNMAGDDSEGEEQFGDFIYSGRDAIEPGEVVKEGEGQLEDIMEDAPSDDGTASPENSRRLPAMNGNDGGTHSMISARPSTPPSLASAPASDDTFPALTTSHSISGSLGHSAFRRPAAHPQISRLRSISTQAPRFPSASSSSTLFDQARRPFDSPASSGFDLLSRASSISNLNDLARDSDDTPEPSSSAAGSAAGSTVPSDTFRWSPLRRISQQIYPPKTIKIPTTPESLGLPTVLAVSGVIAVGTSGGWVMVFDFGQNLRCICGTEATATEGGAVTALGISQDHTFIAVGHANGSIQLYSLAKPTQPVRSVPPTTLALVSTGRKEGHLVGSRILHLSFVGERHTAIISSDETGLAFYHSLGKVLMLASTDIIRMLGRYPEDPSLSRKPSLDNLTNSNGTSAVKKSSTIFDMASLPLGPAPHPSDSHSLVALITPTKLVIVGLKPSPRTWWRAVPGDSLGSRSAVLSWYPSDLPGTVSAEARVGGIGKDPLLAFAWGRRLRLVQVSSEKDSLKKVGEKTKALNLEFAEIASWETVQSILALQWYNQRILYILMPHHVDVYDVVTRERIGGANLEARKVVSHNYYASAFDMSRPSEETLAYSGSFKTYKRNLFLLTTSDVRAGAILSWADRILGLMQPGTILEAIELTTAYLLGKVDASTIGLPDDVPSRKPVVEPKIREILASSLEFVFSEDRLRDGSHDDTASMQRLFEGLVGTCVRACLATGDIEWLFDDLYERYEQNGIEGIFLDRIEPFVLSGSMHALPPSVSQRLIAIHEERGQFEAAQRIIWHVDPEFLDINQALGLCQRQKLYDALIYVYNRTMHDFVAPLVELLQLVRRLQRHRKQRPSRIGTEEESTSARKSSVSDIEATAPDAYKIFAYLSQALAGLSYPSQTPLSYTEGILARNSLYSFLFSRQITSWPERGGKLISTVESRETEPAYPYLRLLLQFDAEATLDALDLALEESYLEDPITGRKVTRQSIVDILLEVMVPISEEFSSVDRTFLHIFIARNLPKYPQYVLLPPEVLQGILVGLADDPDQSTVDDRQLASEYLLSAYTPTDGEYMITLYEKAGFFRILRSIYKGERRWARLASTYLRDPDVGSDIFDSLGETLRLASKASVEQHRELAITILDAVPTLIQSGETGLQQTAAIVDVFLPDYHSDVIDRLAATPWRQFAYLRSLLEPASVSDFFDPSHLAADRKPSTTLDNGQRLLYLTLLCQHEPSHVIRYLQQDSVQLVNETQAMKICESAGVYDAVIWTIDQAGDTKAAMEKVEATLESRTDLLIHGLIRSKVEEVDEELEDSLRVTTASADPILDQIAAISRVATQICVRRARPKIGSETNAEDLWFRLLSSLVSTVRAVRAMSPAPPKPSDRSSYRRSSGNSIIFHDDEEDAAPLSLRASDLLASLIPTALSSLVSTTSTREVSFPNLMRRLIDSNARSPAADRSYAEFKAIVTSMMDTYAFEGEILAVTSTICDQDLFEYVEELKVQKERGWICGSVYCKECDQLVWGTGDGVGASGGAKLTRSASVSMVVETMGLGGRPPMKKRPSLKGKEVDWPAAEEPVVQPLLEVPSGVVVGKDGAVFHQKCYLLSRGNLSYLIEQEPGSA